MTRVIWIAVGLFGLALPFYYKFGARPAFSRSQLWTGMLVVGLLAATCLVLIRGTQVFAAALAYGLILAGLFTGPAYDGSLSYIWSAENAATFQTVMRIEQLVSSGVSPARQVRFWYDNEEPALSTRRSEALPFRLCLFSLSLGLFRFQQRAALWTGGGDQAPGGLEHNLRAFDNQHGQHRHAYSAAFS